MPNNNMEVKITLTPLGQDEKQNHRTIAITPDIPSVSVGRASKNPTKGLLAAPDNAWFDYPILSRTHAKFTASRNQQEIYLQDCGSTHGTFMDKKRLEPGVEFTVGDGEVITFGQRVTSGAVTYPAKDFYVHSKWESRIEMRDSPSTTTMMPRLVHTAAPSRSAFTNDFEHSSESSREGSVQIIDDHRHTFSVPSSDDELDSEDEEGEVQIASSVQGDEGEVSAATTPDHQAAAKTCNNTEDAFQGSKTGPAPSETRSFVTKGPTCLRDLLTEDGTSQENPINLEGVCTNVIEVDTESEDDGPDILPLHASSKAEQANRSKSGDEPQVARQTSAVTVPTTMAAVHKQSDRDSEIQRHHVVPETQANMCNGEEAGTHELTSSLAESAAEASDGFDTEDDDGFDYDHEFFADDDLEPFPEPSVLNVETLHKSKPKVTFQVGNEKPYHTTLTPPFDEIRPARLGHLSVSDYIDVSQAAQRSWAQRAPSPSDAALARKASDPKMILGRDISFDHLPLPQWPPAVPKTTHSHSTEHALDNMAYREENFVPYSWPELPSPEPRSYDQGPFSSQPRAVIPAPRSPKPDYVKNSRKQATVTWADPHEENDDMITDADRFARTGKQASKITIPSLVENYLAENPSPFKRKYGAMNGSDDVEATPNVAKLGSPVRHTFSYKKKCEEENLEEPLVDANPQSPVDPTDLMWQSGEDNATQRQLGLVDQDTPLPDAQPRENIVQTSTTSVSQESIAELALDSVSTTKTVQEDDTDGPARKKARTSSSSSGGFGKFVMGVGFGLLGAAAAFIATIPASVYEEALREVSHAV